MGNTIQKVNYKQLSRKLIDITNNISFDFVELYRKPELMWSNDKMSLFIESCLLNFPIGEFYSNEKDGNENIIDGHRRLLTLINFLNDKFALSNLKILSNLNNCRFEQLSPSDKVSLEQLTLNFKILQNADNDTIRQTLMNINAYKEEICIGDDL